MIKWESLIMLKIKKLQISFKRTLKSKKNYSGELNRIKKSAKVASSLNIEVHAGHGLDYKTTNMLTKIIDIEEYNIGHFIIGESVFDGFSKVIKNFKKIIKK